MTLWSQLTPQQRGNVRERVWRRLQSYGPTSATGLVHALNLPLENVGARLRTWSTTRVEWCLARRMRKASRSGLRTSANSDSSLVPVVALSSRLHGRNLGTDISHATEQKLGKDDFLMKQLGGTLVTPFGERRMRNKTGVAARQASQRGKQRFFDIGQQLGPHKFDGYVGDNPTGLYVYLIAGCCGKRITYRRALVNKLDNAECCASCAQSRKARRKVAS